MRQLVLLPMLMGKSILLFDNRHCYLYILTATCYDRLFMFHRYLHGCNVLYELVKPWGNTNSVVVADSYYASVQAAIRLWSIGLRFIGTIKTATREFPMAFLGSKVMADGRGDRFGLVSKDASGVSLLSFCWVDRDRRYFISTCSSLAPGPKCVRKRWRQVDPTPNAEPEMVEVSVDQPSACHEYYSACARIDQHNKLRQSSLMLETKIKTTVWWRRVNMSLFGMCVVDAILLAQACQGIRRWLTSSEFVVALVDDLIDNNYERRTLRKRAARAAVNNHLLQTRATGSLEATKQLCAATPTKRPKKNHPKHRSQGRCMVCQKLSSHVCRLCQQHQQDPTKKQYWVCQKPGMACMGEHILQAHPERAAVDEDVGEVMETAVI
jgi:ribosomal protein L37AE/L43A